MAVAWGTVEADTVPEPVEAVRLPPFPSSFSQQMTSMTEDEYRDMMVAGGRSIEGNLDRDESESER